MSRAPIVRLWPIAATPHHQLIPALNEFGQLNPRASFGTASRRAYSRHLCKTDKGSGALIVSKLQEGHAGLPVRSEHLGTDAQDKTFGNPAG